MNLDKVTLAGRRVRLEPLSAAHAPGLAAVVGDGDLSSLPVTTVPYPGEVAAFIEQAEAARAQGRELAFATIDVASGAVVGSTRFRAIEHAHRRVEIGNTFIARSWQRSYINTEAKYLMLRHAFDTWQVNRVELLTDVLNQASRAAIARIGAQQEGILRSHMVMRSGRVRDTVVFSITRGEWPSVRARLESRIGA